MTLPACENISLISRNRLQILHNRSFERKWLFLTFLTFFQTTVQFTQTDNLQRISRRETSHCHSFIY